MSATLHMELFRLQSVLCRHGVPWCFFCGKAGVFNRGHWLNYLYFGGSNNANIWYSNFDGNPLIKRYKKCIVWVGNIMIPVQKTDGVVLGEVPKNAQCLVYLPTLTP